MYNRSVKKTYLSIIALTLMTTFGVISDVSAQTVAKQEQKAPVEEKLIPKTEADFRTLLARMASFQARIQAATTRLAEKGIDITTSQVAIDKTTVALADTKLAIDTYAKAIQDTKRSASKELQTVETSFETLRLALIQSLLSLKGALTDTLGA